VNGKSPQNTSFVFGDFRLDTESQILSENEREIHLPKRPFNVLSYLIENRERIVSRDELLDKFWDGHEVYDDALRKAVGTIRKALNDLEKPPKFIETRYGSGYRFIGSVIEPEISVNGNGNVPLSADQTENTVGTFNLRKSSQNFPYILVSIFAVSLVLLAVLGFYTFRQSPDLEVQTNLLETAAKKRSLAVLPLKNLTGDAANDYLSDGITESLINELSRIDTLKVISRSSVFAFKNKEATAQEIGEKLGVETILEGSLKLNGEKIRVEVRLVNTKDGSVIWASELKDENQNNIFAVQDAIVCQLVADLKVKICGEVPPSERYTKNVKAYQLYLQGLYYRNIVSPENLKKAIGYFEEALKIEPDYALAHEGLSQSYMVMEFNSYAPPGTAAPKALFHAEKALTQDDSLAGANIVLGAVKTLKNYDLKEREKYYTQALLKNPNNRTAILWRSNIYLARGEFEKAEAEILKAQEIDPLSNGVYLSLTELYLNWRKPDKAIEQTNMMFMLHPENTDINLFLASAYYQKGEYEKGLSHLEKTSFSHYFKSVFLAKLGRLDEAKKAVEDFAESEEGKRKPYFIAINYAGINDSEKAFVWLEKSFQMREANLVSLKIEPVFDNLRDDVRYIDLLKRLNLAE
jgi:TolB-like protein/DNA-binding winged helix-turn-helix (wHTH) protein